MHKKEQTADSLMQENKVQEIEFIAELRELEHELVTKQNQLEELELNKKRLQGRVKLSINFLLSRDFSHNNLNLTNVRHRGRHKKNWFEAGTHFDLSCLEPGTHRNPYF